MAYLNIRRLFAVFLALIFVSFLILSPLIDVYGEHDHSCSSCICVLCLTSSGLSRLLETCVLVGVYIAATFYFILYGFVCRRDGDADTNATLVTLKTKITS